jgi:hypothetical protein
MYRTPKIEEFVLDFEFEYESIETTRMVILNFSKKEVRKEYPSNTSRSWIRTKCDWKHEDRKVYTEVLPCGNSFSVTGIVLNFFSQFDNETIIKMLQDGKIRCKK